MNQDKQQENQGAVHNKTSNKHEQSDRNVEQCHLRISPIQSANFTEEDVRRIW